MLIIVCFDAGATFGTALNECDSVPMPAACQETGGASTLTSQFCQKIATGWPQGMGCCSGLQKTMLCLPGGSVKAVHLLDVEEDFFCVAFFWRANEARLTLPTVEDLQSAAYPVISFCDFTQQLPVDLSVFADCLRTEARARGEELRGVVAVNVDQALSSDPMGHMFRLPIRFELVTGEAYAVFWLPAYSHYQ